MVLKTVRDFAEDCNNLMNEVYGIFRSKTFNKFLFVEGKDDKKLLSNKGFCEDNYYFSGMVGKSVVTECHDLFSQNLHYNKITNIAFLIDNDFDHVTSTINISKNLFIHSICPESNLHSFNDLEGFLVNSNSLISFLKEYGLNSEDIIKLKNDVELESRRVGKYRAANELIKKQKSLPVEDTVIFSFEIDNFFDTKNFLFLENDFKVAVRANSKYRIYVDELFLLADQISTDFNNKWLLSRGHDITELISLYMYYKFSINLSAQTIERYLRLSLDSTDIDKYTVINSLKNFFL